MTLKVIENGKFLVLKPTYEECMGDFYCRIALMDNEIMITTPVNREQLLAMINQFIQIIKYFELPLQGIEDFEVLEEDDDEEDEVDHEACIHVENQLKRKVKKSVKGGDMYV